MSNSESSGVSDSESPIDYARTTQQRAGMVVRDRREVPGVILLVVAVATLVGFMTAAAMHSASWSIGLGAVSLATAALGVGWILLGRARSAREGAHRVHR